MADTSRLDCLFKLIEESINIEQKALKDAKDPIEVMARSLAEQLQNSSISDEFDGLCLDGAGPSSGKPLDVDFRFIYADQLRSLLSKFCDAFTAVSTSSDWLELSPSKIKSIILLIENLIVVSVLPSLDLGIGIPLERRVSMFKFWKLFSDNSVRQEQLRSTLDLLWRLSSSNDHLKSFIMKKFLFDIIAAHEQLIYLDPTFDKERYEAELNQLPYSQINRELLLLNGGFNLSGRKSMPPDWFLTAVNKRLSVNLTAKNGLMHLFAAFNDLGGETFWRNSVALSSVAVLLSTKPRFIESYQKYAVSMFEQFLEIMRFDRLGVDISLLFALTVERLYAKEPFVVEVQLVDKLVRPWELLLERGLLNPSTPEFGLWNARLDSSILILKSWLNARSLQSSMGEFSFANRFSKLCPFFMLLCGQAAAVNSMSTLASDFGVVIAKLLDNGRSLSAGKLLSMILEDGNNTHVYFKISEAKLPPVLDTTDASKQRRYPVRIEVLEDPMDEETFLDSKMEAVKAVMAHLEPNVALKTVVALMSDCLKSWIGDEWRPSVEPDDIRFVPALNDAALTGLKKMPVLYVLGNAVDILGSLENQEFDKDAMLNMLDIAQALFSTATKKLTQLVGTEIVAIEAATEDLEAVEAKTTDLAVGLVSAILTTATEDDVLKQQILYVCQQMQAFVNVVEDENLPETTKQLYQSAAENSKQIMALVSVDLGWTTAQNETTTISSASKKSTLLRQRQSEIENWKTMLVAEEEAYRGGALIEIAKALRQRNQAIFKSDAELEWVWREAADQLRFGDSYVFLAAVNALSELAYWHLEPYLGRLVDLFLDDNTSTSSEDATLMFRGKIGEALAKVFRQLGSFSPLYFDHFSNGLLTMTESGDELLQSSALSSFADLVVACRGRRYDSILHQLLLLVDRFLRYDDSALVRRSAVHLLRSLLSSADEDLLSMFNASLRDIHRQLKHLWLHDRDEVVRFHAELVLHDLKKIMTRFFQNMVL